MKPALLFCCAAGLQAQRTPPVPIHPPAARALGRRQLVELRCPTNAQIYSIDGEKAAWWPREHGWKQPAGESTWIYVTPGVHQLQVRVVQEHYVALVEHAWTARAGESYALHCAARIETDYDAAAEELRASFGLSVGRMRAQLRFERSVADRGPSDRGADPARRPAPRSAS